MRLRTLKNYALGFAVSALAANALLGDRGLVDIIRARHGSRALAHEIAVLRAENAALRIEARRLKTDPAAIEHIARKELGLAGPGEQLILVRRR